MKKQTCLENVRETGDCARTETEAAEIIARSLPEVYDQTGACGVAMLLSELTLESLALVLAFCDSFSGAEWKAVLINVLFPTTGYKVSS